MLLHFVYLLSNSLAPESSNVVEEGKPAQCLMSHKEAQPSLFSQVVVALLGPLRCPLPASLHPGSLHQVQQCSVSYSRGGRNCVVGINVLEMICLKSCAWLSRGFIKGYFAVFLTVEANKYLRIGVRPFQWLFLCSLSLAFHLKDSLL